ncbi:MAG: response regulator transcription factor [Lachnospiraceae bacterium]|nr:response regulator transcription factor [Lachnospiraceae bacterium]
MNDTTILVVDDDKEIADLIKIYLENDGFQVLIADNGVKCLKMLESHQDIKLLILDIMMPEMDGLSVLTRIRKNNNIPVILLSAKSEDMDKINGFGMGADDYVTKPFHPLELIARVKSQLKRYVNINLGAKQEESDEIVIKEYRLNKQNHTVYRYDELLKLTPIEFDIFYLLASNPGKVFSTEEIFEQVWKEKSYEVGNTVMVHIRRLREKIESDTRNPQILKTVWGVGYKVEDE